MIHINLLPVSTESKPFALNPIVTIAIPVVALVVILTPFNLTWVKQRNQLESDKANLNNKLDRYTPIIKQVEALETAQGQLKQRKTVIEQLQSERLRYPEFMDDFVKLLPGNLWLTTLSTTMQPAGNAMSVSMDVVSLDNYAIADMISNLETSQIFTDVDLQAFTATPGANGTQSIVFHVTANYHKVSPLPDAVKKS